MARDGTGNYVAPNAPVVTGTSISSTSYNSSLSDIGSALTQSIAKDGQTIPTANLPMGTFRHTGVGNGSARTDYLAVGQLQDGTPHWAGTSGGTANAITLSISPSPTAYVDNLTIDFIATNTNTAATTLNLNGIGVVNIGQGMSGSALGGREITASALCRVTYYAGSFRLIPAAVPLSPVILGGMGSLSSTVGGALTLPGTATQRYAYYSQLYVAATGAFTLNQLAGTAAGGTTLDPGSAGNQWFGFYWRVS